MSDFVLNLVNGCCGLDNEATGNGIWLHMGLLYDRTGHKSIN